MQKTTNYGFNKPEQNEYYNVNDFNENMDIVDEKLKEIEDKVDPKALSIHVENKNNPHGVTAEQVGLGNVPNVDTNNQTPTYAVTSNLSELTSGEKLSVAFGKIAKAISSLISHLADATIHVTSTDKANWNAKASGTHKHTKSDISDFPSTMPPSAHNQSASTITAGTFAGRVRANDTAMATLTNAQVRDACVLNTSVTEGDSSPLPNGTLVFTKG